MICGYTIPTPARDTTVRRTVTDAHGGNWQKRRMTMRMIDADALKQAWLWAGDTPMLKLIEDAPTIDVTKCDEVKKAIDEAYKKGFIDGTLQANALGIK